jgi:hypothetical protein
MVQLPAHPGKKSLYPLMLIYPAQGPDFFFGHTAEKFPINPQPLQKPIQPFPGDFS